MLETQKPIIKTLIKGCTSVEVCTSPSAVPAGCAVTSVPAARLNVHVLVRGKVDIDAELAKLLTKVDINAAALAKGDAQAKSADWDKTPDTVRAQHAERMANLESEKQTLLAAKKTFESLKG